MEKQAARRRINLIAGHFAPTDDLSASHVFPMVLLLLPLLVFRLVVLGSVGWRFLFAWRTQKFNFFSFS